MTNHKSESLEDTRLKLIRKIRAREKIVEIGRKYPLALARLWVPHCHRWKGKTHKRDRGCGRPMIRTTTPGIWTCPICQITEARTCQADALISPGREATLLTGGNRSGKTQAGAMLAVAVANGKNKWWVREWMNANNIPDHIIPDKPSTVWASALSYADAISYVRPKIKQYCPHDTRFTKWRAQDRASVQFEDGGRIISLSADSGREKYQGSAVSMVWMDEEQSFPIFQESMLRCVDNPNSLGLFLTMTPLKGLTWVHDLFIAEQKDGFKSYKITGLDNPWISSVRLQRAVQHMSDESKQSRLFGDFTNQQGLVYSEFNHQTHVVKSFNPPKEWERFRAIDFGCKNPFVCLWFALDPADDVLHCYREYFKTERTTLENGREINRLSKGDPPVVWTVADPESRDGRLILARECNIPNKPALKAVTDGINLVKERLAPDAEGKPHLLIHDSCKQLLREFRLYRWADSAGADKPIKRDDHGMDSLRYQIMFLSRFLRINR